MCNRADDPTQHDVPATVVDPPIDVTLAHPFLRDRQYPHVRNDRCLVCDEYEQDGPHTLEDKR